MGHSWQWVEDGRHDAKDSIVQHANGAGCCDGCRVYLTSIPAEHDLLLVGARPHFPGNEALETLNPTGVHRSRNDF